MEKLSPALRQDRSLMNKLERLAATIVEQHGDRFAGAERSGGWVNASWLTDHFAVRIGLVPGTSDLLREAELGSLLPEAVGYPETVDAGRIDGHEYHLTVRIPGTNLGSAWPTLDSQDRARAIRELWEKAEHVHRVEVEDVRDIVPLESPLYSPSLDLALRPIARLEASGLLTRPQVRTLSQQLQDFYAVLDAASPVLNHGDLWVGNAVWDGAHLASLLDFEFAVISSLELDLNELVKHVFAPEDTVLGHDGDKAGLQMLRDVVAEIASAHLRDAASKTRLLGYSILLESWLASRQLDQDGADDLRGEQSYRLLTAIADAPGGHIQPLLMA